MEKNYLEKYLRAVNYLGVPNCPQPTFDEISKMKNDGWLVEDEDPEQKFQLDVQNLVMCTRLVTRSGNPVNFNLGVLAARLAKYGVKSRKAFTSVIFTIDSPDDVVSAVVILYGKGPLLVMGIKTVDEFYQATSLLIRRLCVDSGLDYPPVRMEGPPKIINIVSSGVLPASIDTSALLTKYPEIVTMRKKQFSGASILFMTNGECQCRKIVGLAFGSTKFVVNGYRDPEECRAAIYVLLYILWSCRTKKRKRREPIKLANPEIVQN